MSRPRALLFVFIMAIAAGAFALDLPPGVTAEATGPGGAVVHYTASGGGDDHNGRPTIVSITASPDTIGPPNGSSSPSH